MGMSMDTKEQWSAVYDAEREALLDAAVHLHPPTTEEEVGFVAEKVTDHLVARFVVDRRR